MKNIALFAIIAFLCLGSWFGGYRSGQHCTKYITDQEAIDKSEYAEHMFALADRSLMYNANVLVWLDDGNTNAIRGAAEHQVWLTVGVLADIAEDLPRGTAEILWQHFNNVEGKLRRHANPKGLATSSIKIMEDFRLHGLPETPAKDGHP